VALLCDCCRRSSGCLGTNLDIQLLEPVEINDDIGAFYAGTPVVKGYGNDFRRGVVVGARRTGPGEHDRDAIVLFDESDGELSDEGNGSVASSSFTPLLVEPVTEPAAPARNVSSASTTSPASPAMRFAAIGLPITELVANSGHRQTTSSDRANVHVPTLVKRRLAATLELHLEQKYSHCGQCDQLVETPGGPQGLDVHVAECEMRQAAVALVALRLDGGQRAPVPVAKVGDRVLMITNCLDQLAVATKLQRFRQVGCGCLYWSAYVCVGRFNVASLFPLVRFDTRAAAVLKARCAHVVPCGAPLLIRSVGFFKRS